MLETIALAALGFAALLVLMVVGTATMFAGWTTFTAFKAVAWTLKALAFATLQVPLLIVFALLLALAASALAVILALLPLLPVVAVLWLIVRLLRRGMSRAASVHS